MKKIFISVALTALFSALSLLLFSQTTPTLQKVVNAGSVAYKNMSFDHNHHAGMSTYSLTDKKYVDSIIPVLAPTTTITISGATGTSPSFTVTPTSIGAWSWTGNTGTTPGTNFIGTTDNQDLVFKTNGTEKMRLMSANDYVGINTSTPFSDLEVVTEHGTGGVYFTKYSTGDSAAAFVCRKARGTKATPTAVLSGDRIGLFGARGYGATGFSASSMGAIYFVAAENLLGICCINERSQVFRRNVVREF